MLIIIITYDYALNKKYTLNKLNNFEGALIRRRKVSREHISEGLLYSKY